MLNKQNKKFWQKYKPGEVPGPSNEPPLKLLKNKNYTILDIGTGDGLLAEKFSKDGFNVCAIDIAKNIINENKKRKTKVKYSIQDITQKTNFPNNHFNLIIFKFTLTNIHKESWNKVGKEVFRLLKPGGFLWTLEPLVSNSYRKRYVLASNFINDKNCVYVFYEKDLASQIRTKEDLGEAIRKEKVSRIVKHYTEQELKRIFIDLSLKESNKIEITSPSGFKINTFEGIFQKI